LKFAIDELLIDELSAYLVAPVAKRYWLIFLEISKRSVKKNSAQSSVALEKETEQALLLMKFIWK